MDQSMLQSFLSERVDEVKHATSIISDAILDKDDGSGSGKASQQAPAGAARGTTGRVSQEPPPIGTPAGPGARAAPGAADAAGAATPGADSGTDPEAENENENAGGGPSRFLSQRTRQAVDDVLRDPDLERLTGRARGFARERLLQAEAAARVLKEGEEEEEGEGDGVSHRRQRGGREPEERREGKTSASGSKRRGDESDTEQTPIISGLVNEASEFVAGRVGQAKAGAREVVEAAADVRRSRRAAAAAATAAAERPEKDEAGGGGGVAVGETGKAGEMGKNGGKI